MGVCDQQALCFIDPKRGQIFVSGTSQESFKKPGQILGSDIDQTAEAFHRKFLAVVAFDFFHNRFYISFIQFFLFQIVGIPPFYKFQKKIIAAHGQGFFVCWRILVLEDCRSYETGDPFSLGTVCKDKRTPSDHFADTVLHSTGKCSKAGSPVRSQIFIKMSQKRGDQNALSRI